jgi:hypothetical protein
MMMTGIGKEKSRGMQNVGNLFCFMRAVVFIAAQ